MDTLNRRAEWSWRAWQLTKLNVPVKIIGGAQGAQAPRPLPAYATVL